MKRNFTNLSLFLFLVVPLIGFAQSSENLPDPMESLASYHEKPRESVFLHLNKTSYVQGEEIWFAGYVLNRKSGKAFKETTNVYVGLYDDKGNQLDKRLFMGKDGYLKGSFFLDSTYLGGNYYLKAQTNWMRNFLEDDSYVQKVKVLTSSSPERSMNTKMTKNYDVQFLPEGGNLVEGVENNVGLKILNASGYGEHVEDITILDQKGTLITKVSTSKFGMAKFGLKPLAGNSYSAKVKFKDGQIETYQIPKAKTQGLVVRLLNNPNHEAVGLIFEANKRTLEALAGRKFYFLLHQETKAKKIPVTLGPSQSSDTFFLDRKDLKKGVNMITLFDDNNRPILERMFFNKQDFSIPQISFNIASSVKDSLTVYAKTDLLEGQVSVSVLPANTIAYSPTDNIISTVYLKPYLKGFIENPAYYFQSESNKLNYELDVLLLTQGWSRYEWDNIFYKTPKEYFVFEDGVLLRGSVNTIGKKGNGKVLIHTTRHHGQQLIPMEKDKNKFVVTSFFPENDEKIFISLADKSGKLERPGAYLTFTNNKFSDKLNRIWSEDQFDKEVEDLGITEQLDDLVKDKTIRLNEVVVSEEKAEPLANNNTFIPAFLKGKVTEIVRRDVQDFIFFTDVIRTKLGLEVVPNSFGGVNLRSRRGAGINLIVDGIRQPNFNLLYRLPTGQIESYWLDRLSRYEGAQSRLRETLYVYTRRGKELDAEADYPSFNAMGVPVKNGFEPSKKFYLPKYATFEDKAFESYGTVHWEPDFSFNDDGLGQFNIFDTGISEFVIFVEGMSPDGKVISSASKIKLPAVN